MTFQEIEKLNKVNDQLSDFPNTTENQVTIETIKSNLGNIIHFEIKNEFLLKKLNSISFKPTESYFPEMENKIREESWQNAIVEINEVILLVINELQKNALVSSQEDIEKIISKGSENNFFEFKSTLRWDLKESKINKELEQVVVKSIASFSNCKGGNLLIGVENNGNILGLSLDYKTWKDGEGTNDEFELHLRNLLENSFGINFTTNQLDIKFPVIKVKTNDLEICHIKILPTKKPLFVAKKDKQGVTREVFYIRSGNSSKEIEKMSEFFEYAKSRFKTE